MVTHTLQKIEFNNIKEIVDDIERKFPVDPGYRDWKSRKEINIRCPECTDRKYHLGLNFAKNTFNCFRCPYSGRLVDFLKKHRIKFDSESRIISPEINVEALRIKIPKDFQTEFNDYEKAIKYLESRGFDRSFLFKNFEMWPITNKTNYYYGYIIICLNDYAFYARKYLDNESLKNMEKHIIRKSDKNMKLFYAFEKNNSSTILVVESMFNLMKAAQFGFNSVCIFGKEKWLSLVEYVKKTNNRSLCLSFDKDVKIKDIELFSKKLTKNCENLNISYIDPKDMEVNDIALISNRENLIKLIKNKKNINEIFLDSIDLGEMKWRTDQN